MAPRTTPPATTEESKFFRDGVTAASATKGLAIIAATPTVTPAITASALLSFCWALQTHIYTHRAGEYNQTRHRQRFFNN
jgi:hypothetical protein